MLPSLHDSRLISYEINCEERRIKLYVRCPERAKKQEGYKIEFEGVEGYHFENDAFGNIIMSLEEVSAAQLISKYGWHIEESFRKSGAPGSWAADIASASEILAAEHVRGFILSASYGLSGWVLAREVAVERS